jgi:hypothetical protein
MIPRPERRGCAVDFRRSASPDFDDVYAIRPRSAMTWQLADYDGSQCRWQA